MFIRNKIFELKILLKFLLNLNTLTKKLILIIIDIICFLISLVFSLWLINDDKFITSILIDYLWIFPVAIIIGIPLYLFSGQYKEITRYISSTLSYKLLKRNAVLMLSIILVGQLFNFPTLSLKFYILFWVVLSALIGEQRLLIKKSISKIKGTQKVKKSVAIYGAGVAGSQLAASLKIDKNLNICRFFDDDDELWGRTIEGITISSFGEIKNKNLRIEQVLLAMPTIKEDKKQAIIKKLESLNIKVLQIPSLEDILRGKAKIENLIPLNAEDLLGREKVDANLQLISKGVNNLTICITGAGGSIGSELCRQISSFDPKKIIIIERNEPSLYLIKEELKLNINPYTDIVSYLGCAQNEAFVEKIFDSHQIDAVFHCAAYKHVPIVEENPIEGIKNNMQTTKVLCKVSEKANVKKFILISSDKAVRPTNIMGASKRVCEMITFSFFKKQLKKPAKHKTIYSIVRFGNVLESSGSVVPLFKKQIKKGGPLTLTDKNVIRYFMTVTEAAQLVIQASSLSEGGELFLLDMGKAVNIYNLAKRMIKLSGKSIKNELNPDGDIEIKITGLRPGEKLYEELLINNDAVPTKNKLIYKSKNEIQLPLNFQESLTNLEEAIKNQNEEKVLFNLSKIVPLWDKQKVKR